MEQVATFLRTHWEWATGILATAMVAVFLGRAIYIRTLRITSKQTASKGSVAAGGNITVTSETGNAILSTGHGSPFIADWVQVLLIILAVLALALFFYAILTKRAVSKQSAKDSSISAGKDVSAQSVAGHSLVLAGSGNIIVQNILNGEITPELLNDLQHFLAAAQNGQIDSYAYESNTAAKSAKRDTYLDRVKEPADKLYSELTSLNEEFGPDEYAQYLEDAALEAMHILDESGYASKKEKLSLAALWANIASLRAGDASPEGLMRAYWNALYLIPLDSGHEGAGIASGISSEMAIAISSYIQFGASIRYSHISQADAITLREMALRRELEILDATFGPYDSALVEVLCRNASFYYTIDTPHLGDLMCERVLNILRQEGYELASAKRKLVETLSSCSKGMAFLSDKYLMLGIRLHARRARYETLDPEQGKKFENDTWNWSHLGE